MSDVSRRFTDREVALVIERAAELDEEQGSSGAAGLSLQELTGIARDVGISAEAIERAVASLDRGRKVTGSMAGAPLVRKAAHAVPGRLDRDAIAKLVRLVDDETDSAGSVSEALGSVRWTSSDRFRSSRVSITPGATETSIEVVEKAAPRMRRIFHAIPAAWAVMLAGPAVGALHLPAAGAVAVAALSAVLGAGIGRGVWAILSERSATRVRRLAEQLADAAFDASHTPSAPLPPHTEEGD